MTPSSIHTTNALKIVVDTNQFLSVFIFRGQLMKLVFELVLDRKIELYVSPALKEEISKKLEYFGVSKELQKDILFFIDERGTLLNPTVIVERCRDKDDNFALELSETATADYLITRDKDLLDLKRWKGAVITKPEDFLPHLRTMGLIK